MAKKEQPKNIKDVSQTVTRMNKMFFDIMNKINPSDTGKRDKEIQEINMQINDIVSSSFYDLTNTSEKNYDHFFNSLAKQMSGTSVAGMSGLSETMEDMFELGGDGIIEGLKANNRNDFVEYEDLEIISKHFYEIGLAIEITRDSILQGDNPNSTVARVINILSGGGDEELEDELNEKVIENMERDHQILQKVNDHVVPNTLIYGRYYVYTVPYSEIYAQHVRRLRRTMGYNGGRNMSVKEAVSSPEYLEDDSNTMQYVSESALSEVLENTVGKKPTSTQVKTLTENVKSYMNGITTSNEHIPIPLIEDDPVAVTSVIESTMESAITESSTGKNKTSVDSSSLMDEIVKKANKQVRPRNTRRKPTPSSATSIDGVIDIDSMSQDDYKNIEGCFVKLIKPQQLIPIKIMNQTIGYYYLHEDTTMKNQSAPFTHNLKMELSKEMSRSVGDDVISLITNQIVMNLNKPFLEKNANFKELIANSLMHFNVNAMNVRFQFIPHEYITEFAVDRDTEGEGRSILKPALFHAKLYLSLLIFKTMAILNLSVDQRLMYVKTSGYDTNLANKIQGVVRSHKRREVNALDVMSNYKSLINKSGAGRMIAVPVGPDGDRGIDYEVLQGQNIELDQEFMEKLHSTAINTTGVPSVMINQVQDVDYARRLDMLNTKFLSRVVSYRNNISTSMTSLYRKILLYGGYVNENDINRLSIELSPTQYMNSNLFNEIMGNAETAANMASEVFVGPNSDRSDLDNRVVDILRSKIVKDMASSMDLTKYEGFFEEAKLEAAELENKKRQADRNAELATKLSEDSESEEGPTNSPFY